MRRRRRHGSEDETTSSELNIVPFLDVVVNLMIFLLATTTAALAVAQVEVELPGHCVGCPAPPPGLELSVTLADRGIIVAGRGGRLSPGCESTGGEVLTIPRDRRGYDFTELARCLARVHARFPAEDSVIVTADPSVPYEDVIGAIDAARGTEQTLFPRVLVSAGVRSRM